MLKANLASWAVGSGRLSPRQKLAHISGICWDISSSVSAHASWRCSRAYLRLRSTNAQHEVHRLLFCLRATANGAPGAAASAAYCCQVEHILKVLKGSGSSLCAGTQQVWCYAQALSTCRLQQRA